MTDESDYPLMPLPSPMLDAIERGTMFAGSYLHSQGRGGRFIARSQHGEIHVVDLYFHDRLALFRTVDELNVKDTEFSVQTAAGTLRARGVMDNTRAREVIEDFCLDCEEFSWSGKHGPVCGLAPGAGCQCKEFKDPEWSCPKKLFGPISITIRGKDQHGRNQS